MHRTITTLSDGRELVYYDDRSGAVRDAVDARGLPPTRTVSELRHDPLVDEWVVVASHRQGRTHLPPADQCPLCPTRGANLTEVPSPEYDVVVFENRFPSLTSGHESLVVDEAVPGVERLPGNGRCEVVCFTSEHGGSFASLPPHRVRTVVDAWADRTRVLSALPGVAQVFCFENRGEAIGVTLHHPHGQIYAYPFVTPRSARMLEVAAAHQRRTGRNLFADVLAREQAAEVRVVASTEHWTAFVPAAARWPVEVHLYPHRQVADLAGLTDAERDDFAGLYLDVLGRFDRLYEAPLPYIASWHQAPVREGRDLSYLHLQLCSIQRSPGKLKYLAGSESGMGVFINDVAPESAAAQLRAV